MTRHISCPALVRNLPEIRRRARGRGAGATTTAEAPGSKPGAFVGRGGSGSLLCAKAFGMLAANVFLQLACRFTNRSDFVRVVNIADNKTLIDRCTDHLQYNDLYPNAVLYTERDVTKEAYWEATKLPIQAIF